MSEDGKGLKRGPNRPTPPGEENLMFKAVAREEGCEMFIALPVDDTGTDLLLQALGGIMVAAAKQLGDAGKVCHPGCALNLIIHMARRECQARFPDMWEGYMDSIRASMASRLGEVLGDQASVLDEQVDLSKKRNLH